MENSYQKTAARVAAVSVGWNLLLTLLKLAAGIIARSGAMVSDAVHSGSDVLSSLVVIAGVKLAGKAPDKDHPYGHERLECMAALLLAGLLAATGGGIGYTAAGKLAQGGYAAVPGKLALAAAVLSIVTKEAMFWYTRHYAKLLDSSALMADAWHHRSDALSSVGALLGIGGAMIGFPILEPAASLIICLFIEKAALDIFRDATDKLVDKACDGATEAALRARALETPGVLRIDLLKTRMFGSKIYVEMEIGVSERLTLPESHAIAESVHGAIEAAWPKVKHIMIHVNPVPDSV